MSKIEWVRYCAAIFRIGVHYPHKVMPAFKARHASFGAFTSEFDVKWSNEAVKQGIVFS